MNAKLLFENKTVDVVVDQLPTLGIKDDLDENFASKLNYSTQHWLPIKVNQKDLWVGKRNVILEFENKRYRLSGCIMKDGNLVFNKSYYAI